MNSQSTTYLCWKAAIERHLLSLDIPFDSKWWTSQRARLNMMYDAGEPIRMASEAMEIFARGNYEKSQFGITNPLNPKLCIKFTDKGIL